MKRAERREERFLCLLQLLNWNYMDSASAVLRTTYINLLLLIKWCYFLIHFNYWGYLNTLMKVPLCFYWLVFEQYFWILSLAYSTSFFFSSLWKLEYIICKLSVKLSVSIFTWEERTLQYSSWQDNLTVFLYTKKIMYEFKNTLAVFRISWRGNHSPVLDLLPQLRNQSTGKE